MVERFAEELDAYERELATRIGHVTAREARHEMRSHLEADYAARLEFGASPAVAREEALRAIGDLREVAQHEETSVHRASWAGAGLVIAAAMMLASWWVPGLTSGAPRMVLTLGAALLTVAAVVAGIRSESTRDRLDVPRAGATRSSVFQWTIVISPALLMLVAYLPITLDTVVSVAQQPGRLGVLSLLAAVSSAAILAVVFGGIRKGIAWSRASAIGGAFFVAQTVGVEISVRAMGAHPSYPVDVTLGTWLAFTLPLLILSGIGGGITALATRGSRTLRTVNL